MTVKRAARPANGKIIDMRQPNNPTTKGTKMTTESPLPPHLTARLNNLDARIAALDERLAAFDSRMAIYELQVRSSLLASDAGAQSTVALAEMVAKQGEYLDALDVLWRARLVTACDRVMAAADDSEPSDDDLMMVDSWKTGEDLIRRVNRL